jgi:ribonuclease J
MLNELNLKQAVIDHLGQKIFDLTQRRPLVIPIVVDLFKG